MGNVNIKKDAYILTQTGKEIQTILDNVKALNSSDVKELCKLLAEIKDYESGDDSQSIGQQLINALNNMVREDEVQTEVNDSTYPPQSKAVKDAIEAHKNAPELDHADGSIKGRHIADGAIGNVQISDKAVTTVKIADGAIGNVQIINGSITEEKLDSVLKNNIKNTNDNLNSLSEFIGKDDLVPTVYVYSTIKGTKISSEDGISLNGAINIYTTDVNGDEDLGLGWSGKTYIGIDTDTYSEDTYLYIYLVVDNGKYRFELFDTLIDESVDFGKGNASIYVARIGVKTSSSGNSLDISNIEPFERILTEGVISPFSGLTACGAISKNSEMITSCQNEIANIRNSVKGTWHYGTELTHTENLGDSVTNNSIEGNVGDFYLNKNTFAVYFCVGDDTNNHNWLYIGNLTGSVDTSKWAPINSPVFTGIPTAPTATTTNNSAQIATTEFVRNAIDKYASGGDNTGNIGNILVPLFLSQLTAHVNIWIDDKYPGTDVQIVDVTATKSWITAEIPTIEYDSQTHYVVELTDVVLYCQITSSGIYVGTCYENNAPYGALTSALPNRTGNNIEITLI